MRLTANAASSPDAVTVTGSGVLPALTLSPASLDFSGLTVGQTSSPRTVVVTKTGRGTPAVTGAKISGGGLSSAADTCSGVSVAPGATCTVPVSFTPRSAGASPAPLSFTSNAPGGPHAVALGGVGAAAPSEQDQTLAAMLPKKIRRSGLTVITPANARTNAGQQVRTTVSGRPLKKAAGKGRYFAVVRGPNGNTSVRTFGYRNLRLKVTQQAPVVTGYTAFHRQVTYLKGTLR